MGLKDGFFPHGIFKIHDFDFKIKFIWQQLKSALCYEMNDNIHLTKCLHDDD